MNETRPASMLQPVTFSLSDESELERVPMRPVTEAEEAADTAWAAFGGGT
jgi:hypothetical protein